MPRAIVLVMDSFGIGATEDAHKFGDTGANTYQHIKQACDRGMCEDGRSGPLTLPNLNALGLELASRQSSGHTLTQPVPEQPIGLWGFAEELSTGKDTSSGHWEMMGLPVLYDWGYFDEHENSFPLDFIEAFINIARIKGILGNCHASGTDIINNLGPEHIKTGLPICYTSADSVFQIACHEDIFSQEQLYKLCEVARELLNAYNIARVIARPFNGDANSGFKRTAGRKDFSMPPHGDTLLDRLIENKSHVEAIGKIGDIFAHRGISSLRKAEGLTDLMSETLSAVNNPTTTGNHLIFTNLVDFDTLYGHRRDVNGYALALEEFDKHLGILMNDLKTDDVLIISADHGCDPTWSGTDHTREHIPVLAYGKTLACGNIGRRSSFADIGQSLAKYFNLEPMEYGSDFLSQHLI